MKQHPSFIAALFLVLIHPISSRAAPVELHGVGFYNHEQTVPCLSPQERRAILEQIEESEAMFRAQGRLGEPNLSSVRVFFQWPVVPAPDNNDPGVWGLSGYVDHDPAYPGRLLDYHCGTRTYDLASGYNHRGTDIFTWPFPWLQMDNNSAHVVAAASGVIVAKVDGNYDRQCGITPGAQANYIVVHHFDGSSAWYGHLKQGSLTERLVGQIVLAGQYLGVVGSSGQSTGPHLHLEVYDNRGRLIDPFWGPCNTLNPLTWWKTQKPYYDRAINKVSTHWRTVQFGGCGVPAIPNFRDRFQPGEWVYFYAWGRELVPGDQVDLTIYNAEGAVFESTSYSHTGDAYSAFYMGWAQVVPGDQRLGMWRVEVNHGGTTYSHEFEVWMPPLIADLDIRPGSCPNPLNMAREETAAEAESSRKGGVLPVAVLGSDDFDVAQIDVSTIRLEGAEPLMIGGGPRLRDVATSRGDPGCGCTHQGPDGMTDLRLFFSHRAISSTVGWVSRGDQKVLKLTGQLHNGRSFEASDCVTLVGHSPHAAGELVPDPVLDTAVPNPFNPVTRIGYSIARADNVTLTVYDATGKLVATLVNGTQPAGNHLAEWDARGLASGVYFYRLVVGEYQATKKMVMLK